MYNHIICKGINKHSNTLYNLSIFYCSIKFCGTRLILCAELINNYKKLK